MHQLGRHRHLDLGVVAADLAQDVVGAHTVAPGQLFTMRDAGGGGFGTPANRPRAKDLADVAEGLITPPVAREIYGVEQEIYVSSPGGKIPNNPRRSQQ